MRVRERVGQEMEALRVGIERLIGFEFGFWGAGQVRSPRGLDWKGVLSA